jgi:histidinol-phosphate aminotransferase
VPLGADFALDVNDLRDAIGEIQPAVMFLAYPNNPTGNLWNATAIEALLAETAGLVVVDEAYHAFAQQSFLDRLGKYDNLLVLRTLSKQGLAGLRLGALVGDPAWLAELDKLRLPYNINSLTQVSAAFALAHRDVLDEQARQLRAERERLFQALSALPGIQAWPSRANFILFRTAARSATQVFAGLRERGVLIKNLDATLPGCLRVTVGTPPENAAFLAALKGVLQTGR